MFLRRSSSNLGKVAQSHPRRNDQKTVRGWCCDTQKTVQNSAQVQFQYNIKICQDRACVTPISCCLWWRLYNSTTLGPVSQPICRIHNIWQQLNHMGIPWPILPPFWWGRFHYIQGRLANTRCSALRTNIVNNFPLQADTGWFTLSWSCVTHVL